MKFVNVILILIGLVHNGWANYVPNLMDWAINVINKPVSVVLKSENGFKRISPFAYQAQKNDGSLQISVVTNNKTITHVSIFFGCAGSRNLCRDYISDLYNYMGKYNVVPQQSPGGIYSYKFNHNNLYLDVHIVDPMDNESFSIYIYSY